ncbi:MAG: hypothetical protein ABW085_01050 [Sedimenticola sp.]
MNSIFPLVSRADVDAARSLIINEGLRFEEDYDELVGVFNAGRLIGCGARAGRVLKMLVVDPEHRGGNVLSDIITELMRRDRSVKASGYFIFTKPCAIQSFERLNFRLLVSLPGAGMLEYRDGLNEFILKQASAIRPGNNGAVVISSDPFSKGHLHLIETAASEVGNLYVFVPSEGHFSLSSTHRLALARRCTSHLENVIVVESGPYVLDDETFPGYFLKPGVSRDQLRLAMDMELFARYLAPLFHITRRFVGSEPLDPEMRDHIRSMRSGLMEHGIRLVEIPRKKVGDLWIQARHIRNAMGSGEISKARGLVPDVTYAYLKMLMQSGGASEAASAGRRGGVRASNS